ncbi:MAG: DUF2079 domain-containing protein [Symploca sp. SIO2E6]|nr:DUF2079 domain-containing protein [Symploca sp. SIO2E6]
MTKTVSLLTGASTLIFFLCSSWRHSLFQSAAFDLGFFDQALYLISQGETPIVSFWGYHAMADHAAPILYPLALLYKIYPDIHWLLAVQAIALSLGCWFTWRLALQAALSEAQAVTMAVVYLLYPLVFNVNLFDFHLEVIAIPGLLGAVLAARGRRMAWFIGCLILVLSCKAVLSLTVAAMGFWLLIFEQRRLAGAIALAAGIAWFLITTQVLIPWFSGGNEAAAVSRYSHLGSSVGEIIANLVLKPGLVLGNLFTLPNLEYLVLLFAPVIWGISLRYLTPLVVILPTLAMNFLTDVPSHKNLVHHYSLPTLPFLLLAVIGTLAQGGGWWRFQATRQEAGGRRQEAGGRRQEAESRRQETEGRRQEAEGRRLNVSLHSQFPIPNSQFLIPHSPFPIPSIGYTQRAIILWSLIAFVALAKFGYFGSRYLESLDTRQATREAIALVKTQGSVLTADQIAPHLTHRPIVKLAFASFDVTELANFDYALLNVRHPGWQSTPEFAASLVERLKNLPEFELTYERDGVYLFVKGMGNRELGIGNWELGIV